MLAGVKLSDLPALAGLSIEALGPARHRIQVLDPCAGASPTCITSYPLPLIAAIHAAKGPFVCDEIQREEDPRYVERAMRREVLGFLPAAAFAGKDVLDFGCGAGASTLVLARLLPPCRLVGIELQERLLELARLRAQHLARPGIRFELALSPTELPPRLGAFDFIVMSAVYEHLLPHERNSLLPALWRHLRPGGTLFVNQTPHRWSPIELHTTGLPLINYLPDRLALAYARSCSRRMKGDEDWPALLRAGIRGATVGEILRLLGPDARPLAPLEGDLVDLWYGRLSPRHAWLKRAVRAGLKALQPVADRHLVPELTLAIRKTPYRPKAPAG